MPLCLRGGFFDVFSGMTSNLRIVFAATLALSLASMIALGGQESASEPKWIPFETATDAAIPIVGAHLNRNQAFRMALDFNIPDVVLDEFLVIGTGMKLAGEGESTTIDYYGSKEKVPVFYLETLEVGGVVRRGIRTLLIQGDDIGARDGLPTYGRLGTSFLEPFRLTVHYPRKLLLLEPSPEGEVPAGGAEFVLEERYLTVDAEVNGAVVGRFVIDPATSVTMLDKSWAKKNKLAGKDGNRVDMMTLRVGGFTAQLVPAILEDLKKRPYKNRPAGVIGTSLLEGAAVTYDFPRRLVWLRQVGGSS